MEAAKATLEKVLKIMIILITIIGTVSAILLMILHIKTLPVDIMLYFKEITLSLCLFITYIITVRFNVKYFKAIALLGLTISVFNLIGFKILIKLLKGIGV